MGKSDDLIIRSLTAIGSSHARATCETPSSAKESQVFFFRYLGFRPPLINDRLELIEIILKGP